MRGGNICIIYEMISDERLLDFCRALADTVRSGLSLSETFEILAKSPKYGGFIAGAAKLTAGGAQLHEALAAQKIFPPVFNALVRAGEEGGKTVEFLTLYADCLEIRIDFRRRIARALVYPAFAILLAVALLLVSMLKVVPTLLGPLFTSGKDAPPLLLWFANMSSWLSAHWAPALFAAGLAVLALRAFLRSRPGRVLTALSGHYLPVFRFATREARFYNIYTIIGLLLKAGLAPGAMMDVMLQFSEDDLITRRRFARSAVMLSGGKSFYESLGGLPPEDTRSIEIAEKAGRLDETLLRLGKVHYDRHLHRLKLLVTGFRITAMVTIALLSFGLMVIIMRPVLTALTGSGFGAPAQAAARTPSGQQPQVSWSGGQPLPNSYVVSDPNALFNATNAKDIIELMKKSPGVKGRAAPGVPKPEESKGDGKNADEKKAGKKMLVPTSPMQSVQFRKIKPTDIKPTEIKSGIK